MTNNQISSNFQTGLSPYLPAKVSGKEDTSGEIPKEKVELGASHNHEVQQQNDLKKLAAHHKCQSGEHGGNGLNETMEGVHIGLEVGETLLGGEGAHCAHVAHAAEAAETGSHFAESLMETIAPVGAAAVGVYYGIKGAKEMKNAIKEKNFEEGFEATGKLALSAHSGMEVAHVAAKSIGGGLMHVMESPVVAGLGAGLGVVHGGVDLVMGGKEAIEGIKEKDVKKVALGGLEMGVGSAMIALALGGGVPAAVALGAIFLTKMGVEHGGDIKRGIEKLVAKITGKSHKQEETKPAAQETKPEVAQEQSKPKESSQDTGTIRFENIKSAYGWDLSPEQERMRDLMQEHFPG